MMKEIYQIRKGKLIKVADDYELKQIIKGFFVFILGTMFGITWVMMQG